MQWTEGMQKQLDETVLSIVDIEEAIEQCEVELAKQLAEAYLPAKGTEKMVHLMLLQGDRYSAKTGKEINKPKMQLFSYSEWNVFKKNFLQLGYRIVEVKHDPYDEAKAYLYEEKE